MTLKIAFQMDALTRLNLRYDSTLYLARGAAYHDCELFHYEPRNLRLNVRQGNVKVTAAGHTLKFTEGAENPWSLGEARTVNLADFDAILIRQDPPFDLAYITTTHILDHLRGRVRMVNDPTGIRNAPEKILILQHPRLMAPTLITRELAAIEEFRQEHGEIVLKPLYSFGGHGVFHIDLQNDNLPSLVEMLSGQNNEPWMIQKFLPVAAMGDKRIVLLDGKPVGQYRRVPATGDVRSNARVGGKIEATTLSSRDRDICDSIAPNLVDMGLRLVGIDVIGDYLTEINVTSPTGLVTIDELEGRKTSDSIPEMFWRKVFD